MFMELRSWNIGRSIGKYLGCQNFSARGVRGAGTINVNLGPSDIKVTIQRQITTNSMSYVIYRMVPFPMTSSDPWPIFQGHGVTIGLCLDVRKSMLCANDARSVCDVLNYYLFIIIRNIERIWNKIRYQTQTDDVRLECHQMVDRQTDVGH